MNKTALVRGVAPSQGESRECETGAKRGRLKVMGREGKEGEKGRCTGRHQVVLLSLVIG